MVGGAGTGGALVTAGERLQAVAERATTARLQVALLERQAAQARERATQAAQRVQASDVALHAIRAVRDLTTARVQQRLTELTTEALRVVFDDPDVRLELRSVERRGVVEVDLVLVHGGLATDPLEGNGGGLVADVSAMLRLVMVRMLTRRGLAPLLVLDEPFAALSQGHRGAMAYTLATVAASLGIQVFTSTHADEFARGGVYRVSWEDRDAKRARVVREED